MWKVRNVRHTCGSVAADCLEFALVLMGADDHDVRTDAKLVVRALARLVGNPRPNVHVGNPHCLDVRVAARQAFFHPLKKYAIDPLTGVPEQVAVLWKDGQVKSLGTLDSLLPPVTARSI
jgi:hypothetical protein